VYPAEAGNRFQPSQERWAEVANRVSNLEAIRVNDALGPTNNARMKFLVALVQAQVDIGEPRADQVDTLIKGMIKDLTAANNDHRLKNGNVRLKELLEKRVAEARANSTNSARRISMGDFIHLLGGALAEIERHFNLGVQYGLIPSRATSSKEQGYDEQGLEVRALLRLWWSVPLDGELPIQISPRLKQVRALGEVNRLGKAQDEVPRR